VTKHHTLYVSQRLSVSSQGCLSLPAGASGSKHCVTAKSMMGRDSATGVWSSYGGVSPPVRQRYNAMFTVEKPTKAQSSQYLIFIFYIFICLLQLGCHPVAVAILHIQGVSRL